MRQLFAALAASVTLVAASAAAQTPPQDPLFDEGRTLLDQGRFAEACDKFKATYEQKQTAGKAFNLSVCEERQGHLLRAAQWMSDGMSLLDPSDPRRAGAIERRDGLERRLGRVIVALAEGSPAATELSVDGVRVEPGARVPVDPGKHQVTAKLAGRLDGTVEVDVAESASKPVSIAPGAALEPSAPAPTPLAPKKAAVEPQGRDGAPQRIAGAAVTGLGLASLVGFGVTAGLVSSKHAAFEKASPADRPALASSGKNLEIAEAVLLGVGIAASATGVVLIATAPRRSPVARLSPSFSVGRSEGTIGVRGAF